MVIYYTAGFISSSFSMLLYLEPFLSVSALDECIPLWSINYLTSSFFGFFVWLVPSIPPSILSFGYSSCLKVCPIHFFCRSLIVYITNASKNLFMTNFPWPFDLFHPSHFSTTTSQRQSFLNVLCQQLLTYRGLLHKTFTGKKTLGILTRGFFFLW